MNIFARIMAGDFRSYSELIETTALNASDDDGASLLTIAIVFRQDKIALDLIARGVRIDQTDRKGTTELQNALIGGQWTVASELIKKGADINHRDSYGNNVLWYATTHPKRNLDIVRQLIEMGANATTMNRAYRSPISAAEERGDKELLLILKPSRG